jgi:FkbM family methyltransferase
MLNLEELCRQYKVKPRGIIHVGAHEGSELATYQNMGINRILFIEANPSVFERLKINVANIPEARALNYAISDRNDFITLHVTSMDYSSSILPLKRHKEIYPNIHETHQISVQSKKLDTLLAELHIAPSQFNILSIDIQGAELLAFEGSINLLKHIEAIITEVNMEELYEGCALIDQIDDFLNLHGFERVKTITPHHPSWGDAFYVKKSLVRKRQQTITMSSLGTNGRFANQIFQYAFLRIYAKEHHLVIETPEWIGQYLFGHKDRPISQELPQIRVEGRAADLLADALISKTKLPFANVDFSGYFQFHTKYYAPHKEYFRSLFQPVSEIEVIMKKALNKLRSMGKTIVGLHLRLKDYGYGPFFIAPSKWYNECLENLWETLDEPVLFLASDETKKVFKDFAKYKPITSEDLGIELSKADFYPDFYLLSKCDIVAISNSSYSFAACMLNDSCRLFLRPDLPAEKLISFDPWDSEVSLRKEEKIQLALDYLRAGNWQQVNIICRQIMKTHPFDAAILAEMSINRIMSKQSNDVMLAEMNINELIHDDQVAHGFANIKENALQEIGDFDVAKHLTYYARLLQLDPQNQEAKLILDTTRLFKGAVI